jgi:hypothetical protein
MIKDFKIYVDEVLKLIIFKPQIKKLIVQIFSFNFQFCTDK